MRGTVLPQASEGELEQVRAGTLYRSVQLFGEAHHAEPAPPGQRPGLDDAVPLPTMPAKQAGVRLKESPPEALCLLLRERHAVVIGGVLAEPPRTHAEE